MTQQVAPIGDEDRRERYVLRSVFEGINFAKEAWYPNRTSGVGRSTGLDALGATYALLGDPINPWVVNPYDLSGAIEVPDRLMFPSSGTNLPNAFVVELDPPFYHVGTAGVSRAVEGASVRESLRKTIDRLFVIAEGEHFEDGMESNLTIGLATVLRQYPREAFGILKAELSIRRFSQRILIEVLHFLGRFKGRGTADEQFGVVTAYLYHASPVIRDAAAVALAYMQDKRAIPVLEKVIAGEKVNSLREDMKVVLAELKM